MSLKAVVLVGGAQKGTRFRPLSLQLPKPLFPIAGLPLIEHHIGQLSELKLLSVIYLLGFYPTEQFSDFLEHCRQKYPVPVHYLEEEGSFGTAGGLLHFKNDLLQDDPEAIFVFNADVCGDLPLLNMVEQLKQHPNAECLILTTEATREQSINFGSVVIDPRDVSEQSARVLHYVDKPTTFVSSHISCGIYLIRPSIWELFSIAKTENDTTQLWFETDIFPQMASNNGNGSLFSVHTTRWWSQTKTPAAVLYANRHYLRLYRERYPERLSSGKVCEIVGDVFIDPTAIIHPTAKIGSNVSIGPRVQVRAGVRIRESIVLGDAILEEHSCILHSVIGWRSRVGAWARVEGSPMEPNPNIPFAKLDNKPLFNPDGRLNPSLSILGSEVSVLKETIILNSVVLPYKDLTSSYRNQIIL